MGWRSQACFFWGRGVGRGSALVCQRFSSQLFFGISYWNMAFRTNLLFVEYRLIPFQRQSLQDAVQIVANITYIDKKNLLLHSSPMTPTYVLIRTAFKLFILVKTDQCLTCNIRWRHTWMLANVAMAESTRKSCGSWLWYKANNPLPQGK